MTTPRRKERKPLKMSSGHIWSFVFLLAVGRSSEIKEIAHSYSCCANPKVPFQPSCENTWNKDDVTFAHTNGDSKTCTPPCKNVEGSWMILDACVNVNLSSVCTNMGMPEETTTVYHSQECQPSTSFEMPHGGQGSVYLLVALMTGWYLMIE